MRIPLDSFNAGQVISLEMGLSSVPINILSDDSSGNKIFVRQDYVRLQEHIFSLIDPPEEHKPRVAVLGNPGTGNTYFGLFLLVQCIRNGLTVVYESGSINAHYMFSPAGVTCFPDRDDPAYMAALGNRSTILSCWCHVLSRSR